MRSLFRCPLCGEGLTREETRYACPRGHAFDRAAAGYVHLLPPNRMHSKDPGDDKGMAAARNRFLSTDSYAPLRQALVELALKYAPARPVLLDAGCGEGYYTAGLYQALEGAGKEPRMAGIDLSKHSLRWAAKRTDRVEFAVASVYRLPVPDLTADLLIDCFSPLCLEEFRRVLKPGGVFLYVVPGRDHLWELKKILYKTPYRNQEKLTPYDGFSYREVRQVEHLLTLSSRQAIHDLFQMTPYYWKTPQEGAAKLEALDGLSVTLSFHIHVFRRD